MASLTAQQRQDLIEELPRLKRFCLSLTSDPSDADDLLQITVERLLEKGMPHDAHVAKWSHRVCRNLWIDDLIANSQPIQHHGVGPDLPHSDPCDAVTSAAGLSRVPSSWHCCGSRLIRVNKSYNVTFLAHSHVGRFICAPVK